MARDTYHWRPFGDLNADVWSSASAPPEPKPMHSWDWAKSATDAYSLPRKAKALLVGSPAAPDAVVALSRRPGPLPRYELVGNEGGAVDVRVSCADDAATIARALTRFSYPVRLGDLPEDSLLIPALREVKTLRALVVERDVPVPLSPFLDLDESWSPPDAQMKKKFLQSIKRRERRLGERGTLRFEAIRPTSAAEARAAFDRATAVEARGWKADAGLALEKDLEQRAFFRAYALRAAAQGRLHLAFLTLDDTAIAMSIGEVHDGIYYAYKTGFDDAYRSQAPGILLQYRLIGALAGDGVRRIDFQGQMDGFKSAWTNQAITARQMRVYPAAFWGALALLSDVVLAAVRLLTARVRGLLGPKPKTGKAMPAK